MTLVNPRSCAAAILASLILVSACFAAGEGTNVVDTKTLRDSYNNDLEQFKKTLDSIKDKDAQAKAEEADPTLSYAQRFALLLNEHPRDQVGLDAAIWIASNKRLKNMEIKDKALKLISEHFINSDKLVDVIQNLRRVEPTKQTMAFLGQVRKENPSKQLQGLATLILAEKLADAEKQTDSASEEAIVLFKSLIDNYSDLANAGREKGKLGEIAARYLFEIEHLTVGKPAPEIEGTDLNGKKMSLSKYRGKVVLLTFFGDW